MKRETISTIHGKYKSSDQDELNDSVSKVDIDKMIRLLYAHTEHKVVQDPEPRHSTPKEVKFKTEGSSSTKLPPSPSIRSSSFLLSNALKGHTLFGDTLSCNAYQKPKLHIFSGEEKSETSFDIWKLEVKCVLREGNYTGSSVLQAIRGSLKGKTRSLLLSLSEHATAENVIDKLDGIYGDVYSSEALLETFFKETQQPNQSVAEYGMELESIIQSTVEKGDKSIAAKKFGQDLGTHYLKIQASISLIQSKILINLGRKYGQLSLNWQIRIKVLPLCNINLYHQIPKNLMIF